ncbi:MAG: hypothetical protein ACI8P7_000648, partial [Candidatus Azotimanducaceae bacterium]
PTRIGGKSEVGCAKGVDMRKVFQIMEFIYSTNPLRFTFIQPFLINNKSRLPQISPKVMNG